ncbi:MAG: hypothetical protein QW767_04515 [Thermoprotei archaeon]
MKRLRRRYLLFVKQGESTWRTLAQTLTDMGVPASRMTLIAETPSTLVVRVPHIYLGKLKACFLKPEPDTPVLRLVSGTIAGLKRRVADKPSLSAIEPELLSTLKRRRSK